MDYLVKNTFTAAAGARKGFPKVAMIITDGKSQDPVGEEHWSRSLCPGYVSIHLLNMFRNPKLYGSLFQATFHVLRYQRSR